MGKTFLPLMHMKCGKLRHLRTTNLPCTYCGNSCHPSSPSHAKAWPHTTNFDETIKFLILDITRSAQIISLAVEQTDLAESEFWPSVVHLQISSERLVRNLLVRMRLSGESQSQLPALACTCMERNQKSLKSSNTARNCLCISPTGSARTPRDEPLIRHSLDGTDTSAPSRSTPHDSSTLGVFNSTLGSQDLATILNCLQRTSGQNLQALADRSRISPGFLFQILTGETFPSWENVAAITRACGADSEVLRRTWEASATRHDRSLRPATLTTALRFLYQQVGSPTPLAIATTSGNILDEYHVAELLRGTTTAPWEYVDRLIRILGGDPHFFFPLWQAESSSYVGGHPFPVAAARPQPISYGCQLPELAPLFSGIHASLSNPYPLAELRIRSGDRMQRISSINYPATPDDTLPSSGSPTSY